MANDDVIARPVIEFVVRSGQVQAAFNKMRSDLERQSGQIQTAVNSSLNKVNQQSFQGLAKNAQASFSKISYSAIRMGKQVEQALRMAVVPAAAALTAAFTKFYKSNTESADKFRSKFNPVKKSFDEAVIRIGSMIANSKIFGKTLVEWTKTGANALNKLNSGDIQRFINLITSGLKLMMGLKLAIIGLRFAVGFEKTLRALSSLSLFKGLSNIGNIGQAVSPIVGNALGSSIGAATGSWAGTTGLGRYSMQGALRGGSMGVPGVASQTATTFGRSGFIYGLPGHTQAMTRAVYSPAGQRLFASGLMGRQVGIGTGALYGTALGRWGSVNAMSRIQNEMAMGTYNRIPGFGLREGVGVGSKIPASFLKEGVGAGAVAGASIAGMAKPALSRITSLTLKFGGIIFAVGGLFNAIEKGIKRIDPSNIGKIPSVLDHIMNAFSLGFEAIGSFFDRITHLAEDAKDSGGPLISLSQKQLGFGMLLPRIFKDVQNKWEEMARPESLGSGEYVSEVAGRDMGWSKPQTDAYNEKLKKSYNVRENKYTSNEDAKTRMGQITKDFKERMFGITKLDEETNQVIENYKMGRGVKGEDAAKTAKTVIEARRKALEDTFNETGIPNVPTTSAEVRKQIDAQLYAFQKKIDEAKAGGKLGLPTEMIDEMESTMKRLYDVYAAYMSNLRGKLDSDKANIEHKESYNKAIKEKTGRIGELQLKEKIDSEDYTRGLKKRTEEFNDVVRELGGGTRQYGTISQGKKAGFVRTELNTQDLFAALAMSMSIFDPKTKKGELGNIGGQIGLKWDAGKEAEKKIIGQYLGTTVNEKERKNAITRMNQLLLNRQEKMGNLGYTGESYGFTEVDKFGMNIRKKGQEKQEDIAVKMKEALDKGTEAQLDHNAKLEISTGEMTKLVKELSDTNAALMSFNKMVEKGMPAGEAAGYNPVP